MGNRTPRGSSLLARTSRMHKDINGFLEKTLMTEYINNSKFFSRCLLFASHDGEWGWDEYYYVVYLGKGMVLCSDLSEGGSANTKSLWSNHNRDSRSMVCATDIRDVMWPGVREWNEPGIRGGAHTCVTHTPHRAIFIFRAICLRIGRFLRAIFAVNRFH